MFSALILLATLFGAGQTSNVEMFNELQSLLRVRRSVLGETDFQYFENGEVVAEYSQDGLVTYKQEPQCASEGACGSSVMILERVRREEMCLEMTDNLELCKRDSQLCGGRVVLEKMEEMECAGLMEERRVRRKREACVAVQKRFAQLCGGRKRAISEECAVVLEDMESMECSSEVEFLRKRSAGCPDGWSSRRNVCYKYFSDPVNFQKANKVCAGLAVGGKRAHLATLERMIVDTTADREFFNNLIQSSGAVDHIDSVLGAMDDMFEGRNWREVISYADNWGWIGVQKSGDEWRWATKQNANDRNPVKVGHADWRQKEPSHDNDLKMDNGHCVVYFNNARSSMDSALTDVTDVGDIGAWWNVSCNLELPFICEMRDD